MNNWIAFKKVCLDIETVESIINLYLVESGYFSARNFRLGKACASFSDTACPHHSAKVCDCQLAALTITGNNLSTVSLVLHCDDRETELCIVDGEPLEPELAGILEAACKAMKVLDNLEVGIEVK